MKYDFMDFSNMSNSDIFKWRQSMYYYAAWYKNGYINYTLDDFSPYYKYLKN